MKMLLFVAPPAPPQRTKIGRAGDPGRLRSGPTAVWRWPNPPLTPGLILQLASSPRNAPGLNSAAPAGAGLSLVKDLRGSRLHFESTHLRQHTSAAFTAGIVQILPQAIFNAGLRVAHPTRAARCESRDASHNGIGPGGESALRLSHRPSRTTRLKSFRLARSSN